MVELAKESTTMRQVLDPMFVYFDSGRHWVPLQGLSITVLSDMCYLLESSGILVLLLGLYLICRQMSLDNMFLSLGPIMYYLV